MTARILWAIVIAFLLGVFLRSVFPIGLTFAAFATLLSFAFFFLAQIGGSRYVVPAIALLALSAGVVRMHIDQRTGDAMLTERIGGEIEIEGVVFAEPDVRENSVRLYVRATSLALSGGAIPINAGLLIAAPAHSDVAYGDRVRAVGTLRLPQPFETGLGRSFDYPMYLAKDGVLYELAFARLESIASGEGNPVIAAAIYIKHLYLTGLHRALPEPQSGLAGGITVGDKRGPGEDLSEIFRIVGLVHIVVLSGYNITLVMNAVRAVVSRLPVYVQWGSVAFAVVFFVLMAGGAASAVRAGAMALISVFARATGRMFLAMRILGVVAAAMVLWDPFMLAFDPSFQLSALATLGLISFTPFFSERLRWIPERFGLREIAASTLATQTTVLPLLMYQSGQLSIYALPANLLALVAVSPAMFASFIAAISGIVLGPLAPAIALPAYALLAYVIFVAEFFASLPFAAFQLPAFSAWWLLLVYGMLLLFILKYGGGTKDETTD